MKTLLLSLLVVGGLWVGEGYGQVEVEWEKTFRLDEDPEYASAINSTHDNGFVIAGLVHREANRNGTNIVVAKIDSLGQQDWFREYGGNQTESCKKMFETEDAGFLIFGTTNSIGEFESSAWVMKLNESGDSLWSRTFGTGNTNSCRQVRQVDSDEYQMLLTSSLNDGSAWIISIDSNGDSLGSVPLPYVELLDSGQDIDFVDFVFEAEIVTVACNRAVEYEGTTVTFYVIATLDLQGRLIQRNSFEEYTGTIRSIEKRGGGYFVFGEKGFPTFQSRKSYQILFLNRDLNLVFEKYYGGIEAEFPAQMIPAHESGMALYGSSQSFGDANNDHFLVRISEQGDSLWSLIVDNGTDWARALVMNEDGSYALLGDGLFLVKTTPDPVSVRDPIVSNVPSTPYLLSAYPNPFNNTLNISFGLDKPAPTRLEIVDPTGRKVASLFPNVGLGSPTYTNAGEQRVVWDAKGLPAGKYVIYLQGSGFSTSKSITLLK